jgi:vacuolar-type H+-ATPase subunit E/Vma4
MMTNKIVVDCSTGEVQEIALTAEEIAEREVMAAEYAAQKAQEEAQKAADATAKSALLKKLGITEEEARLLLS